MKRIKKIAVTKENKISLVWEVQNKETSWDEYTCIRVAAPRQEFHQRLQELAGYMVDICELPAEYGDRVIVRSVAFSYGGDKDVMGATLSGQLVLRKSACPLNLNTPHKIAEFYSECGDPLSLMPDGMHDALKEMEKEAFRYIAGDRMQRDLFLKEEMEVMNDQVEALNDI